MAPLSFIQIFFWGRGLGSRGFSWFLASNFLSALGRNGYAVACAWILVASDDGSANVAAFFAIVSLTELLVSPAVGWISDRFDRRQVYILADTVRCIAAGMLMMTASVSVICWSAVLFACCDRVALTASQSMIPNLGKHLASSTSNSVTFFAIQAGGLVAATAVGILLHTTSTTMVFVAVSAAFAMSAGGMWLVVAESESVPGEQKQERGALPKDVRIVHLGVIYSLLYGGGLLVSIMGPGYVFDELSGNAVDFGALESAWSAGSILGALLLIPMARFEKRAFLLVAILAAMAVLFSTLKLCDLPWSLLVFAALGMVYNFGRVASEVILQTIAPLSALGRVKGLFHCGGVSIGLMIFGLISVGAEKVDPSTVFLIFAAGLSISALLLTIFRPGRAAPVAGR